MRIEDVIDYLKRYDGRELKIMEVCGTHTAAIFKCGIRSLISPKIKLISGPGCPVCVTPAAYIDKCIQYATMENHVLMTFGDMMKVPGKMGSLSEAKGRGANVHMMYSPFEAVDMAKKNPEKTIVVAAVGFETTAPAYALMLKEAGAQSIENLRLITALKTAIPALRWICDNQEDVDGFICPGHVSVITGSHVYQPLAEHYKKPFVVAGFEAEHILAALYKILKQIDRGQGHTENMYTNAVSEGGNPKALAAIREVFEPGEAMWRGLGTIEDSGLYLKGSYSIYDGGSRGLDEDMELPKECCCGAVIVGRINPDQCPMFGEACSPLKPFGPCMVSAEGSCGIWYRNTH